ncbi:MAG: cytochrome P450 [Acidimicrobiia bacterium]|nr:cytochrome P450 [Acidimicrobiia bacterium]
MATVQRDPSGGGRRPPRPSPLNHVRALRGLLKDPQPVLDQLRKQVGPVCLLGYGPARMAVVGGPREIRDLFANPNESFRWGHPANTLGFVVGRGSMIVSDGEDHRRRRSPVQHAFAVRRLQQWIPMIVERTDEAIDDLLARTGDEPTTLDLYPIERHLILQIVLQALFGERMLRRTDEFGHHFQSLQDYLELPALRQLPHPIPRTHRARAAADRRALDRLIDDEIAERRRHPSGDPLDVLEVLVQDDTLTDDEIRDQVVTLVGAGYDTTAAAFAWMLWCTALRPGVWERLRNEADSVLGPLDVDERPAPGPEQLRALTLADRVVRETLRLHPPGTISPRQTLVDVTVGDVTIPKRTLVLWSAYLAGRDPEAWEDPLRFDPDRFVELTDEQQAQADAAWVPFGGGARRCIGFALAQMELTLLMARFAQRLDVRPTDVKPPAPVGMVVNRPTGGVPVTVARRGALDPSA